MLTKIASLYYNFFIECLPISHQFVLFVCLFFSGGLFLFVCFCFCLFFCFCFCFFFRKCSNNAGGICMYSKHNILHFIPCFFFFFFPIRNAAGRTGTFCTIQTCLDQIREEQGVDVLQNVKLLRIHRTNMVDTPVSIIVRLQSIKDRVRYCHICDVMKQNQSEVRNIDFKIEPNKAENVFCFLLFLASFNYLYLWNPLTNFNWVFCKMKLWKYS